MHCRFHHREGAQSPAPAPVKRSVVLCKEEWTFAVLPPAIQQWLEQWAEWEDDRWYVRHFPPKPPKYIRIHKDWECYTVSWNSTTLMVWVVDDLLAKLRAIDFKDGDPALSTNQPEQRRENGQS